MTSSQEDVSEDDLVMLFAPYCFNTLNRSPTRLLSSPDPLGWSCGLRG